MKSVVKLTVHFETNPTKHKDYINADLLNAIVEAIITNDPHPDYQIRFTRAKASRADVYAERQA